MFQVVSEFSQHSASRPHSDGAPNDVHTHVHPHVTHGQVLEPAFQRRSDGMIVPSANWSGDGCDESADALNDAMDSYTAGGDFSFCEFTTQTTTATSTATTVGRGRLECTL